MKPIKPLKTLSKQEIIEKIKETFSKNPTPKEIKKTRTLAMSKNVKLKDYRKLYCKKCLTLFDSNNSEIRIKDGNKRVTCKICNHVSRYRMK